MTITYWILLNSQVAIHDIETMTIVYYFLLNPQAAVHVSEATFQCQPSITAGGGERKKT